MGGWGIQLEVVWVLRFADLRLIWDRGCPQESYLSRLIWPSATKWQFANFLCKIFTLCDFSYSLYLCMYIFASQNLGSGDPDELSLISNPSNGCTWLHQKWPRSIIKSPFCIWLTFVFVFVFRFLIVFVGIHPCLAFASKYVLCIKIKRTWISMLTYVCVPLLKYELDSLHLSIYQEL